MKYRIEIRSDHDALILIIEKLLSEGWFCQGGVAVSQSDFSSKDHEGYSRDNFDITYAQAMIKND